MRRDPFKGCDDFRRTRNASDFTRRQLIVRGAAAGLSYYAARAIAPARMLEAAFAQAPDSPVLVSVFLPGGCDLLSTLTPLEQSGRLNDLRRSLGATEAAPLAAESRLGLHAGLGDGLNG